MLDLAAKRSVIVCAGPGGVGKTTAAAAIALEAARLGRRACVVTIDPAKRLADALGLSGGLTNEPRPISGDWEPNGELWGLMLDTKSTFDEVVERYAATPTQAEAILANRLYRNIASALGGTQEYMAMEKLYDLHNSGRFDLIVVDTPPTRRALDFLDAPRRLNRFLENKVFRMLMAPVRPGMRAVGVATNMFLKTVARVVGVEVVTDTLEFFRDFEGMEAGFRARSEGVLALLGDAVTAFVVVFSPRQDAVDEAEYFIARLAEWSMWVEAVVVNRVFPRFDAPPPSMPARPGGAADLVANRLALGAIADAEAALVGSVTERMAGVAVSQVPLLVEDVHDIDGLSAVAGYMFDRAS